MQPSASKAGLLLQCGWAFNNPEVPKTLANEPMKYGSAFHEVLATSLEAGVPPKLSAATVPAVVKKFGIEHVDTFRQHTHDAYGTLFDWLNGANQWDANFLPAPKGAVIVEQAVAYDVVSRKARFAAPVDEHHVYTDVTPDEHPGTVDLAMRLGLYKTRLPIRLRDAVLVLDHKTGVTCDAPRDSAQLKSLALAFAKLWGAKRAIVAINHAPRDGIPAVFADELSAEDLEEHAHKLKPAFSRIGDGSLRPGPECGYCAGNAVCPAYGGSLAALTSSLQLASEPLEDEARKSLALTQSPKTGGDKLTIDTPQGMGLTHMILQMMDRVHKDWSERIKNKLREDPDFCGVRPDGMMTVLKVVERENLSLASIKRACSVPEAQKIEKMLREKGCIEKTPREELRAVRDR
jgi:hypothetical protein